MLKALLNDTFGLKITYSASGMDPLIWFIVYVTFVKDRKAPSIPISPPANWAPKMLPKSKSFSIGLP
jgi:hypothetical protein